MSGVGGCFTHAVRMNSAATAATAFRYARQLFAFIVWSYGTGGVNAARLAAVLPAEILTRNRTSVASFKFGSTLTVQVNGGNHGCHVEPYFTRSARQRCLGLPKI